MAEELLRAITCDGCIATMPKFAEKRRDECQRMIAHGKCQKDIVRGMLTEAVDLILDMACAGDLPIFSKPIVGEAGETELPKIDDDPRNAWTLNLQNLIHTLADLDVNPGHSDAYLSATIKAVQEVIGPIIDQAPKERSGWETRAMDFLEWVAQRPSMKPGRLEYLYLRDMIELAQELDADL